MDELTFDDFLKVDIRKGTVKEASVVPKSKKLLKLLVSFGPEVGDRQILAGIGETFTPNELIGKGLLAVVNLPPREMMGMMSTGMVLCGKDSLLHLTGCDCEDGVRIG